MVINPGPGASVNSPKSKHIFRLGFPYVQFYFQDADSFDDADDLYLTFSKKPVKSIEDSKVCFPFLPNIYSNNLKVCLGISGNILSDIEYFWESSFYVWTSWYGIWAVPSGIKKYNLGDFDRFFRASHRFCDMALRQFEAWEEGTKREGVDFISNLRWPKMFKNLPAVQHVHKGFGSLMEGKIGRHFG